MAQALPPVDDEQGEDGELRCGTANGEFFHGETNSSVWRSRPGPLHKRGIPPTRGPEGTPPSLPTDPNPLNNPAEAKEAREETRAQPRSTTSPPTTPLQWPQGTGPCESQCASFRRWRTPLSDITPCHRVSKRRGQGVGRAEQERSEGARGGEHKR